MFLSSALTENLGLVDAGIIALLGYAVVFFGLILLQLVLIAMGKYFISQEKKAAAAEKDALSQIHNPAPVVSAAPAAPSQAAPGTAGNLKLYDTPPKTAAMIMAIVADKTGKPLNELRFKSIREVK